MNLKSALLSLVVLAGTAGTALADYAVVDNTSKVRDEPHKYATVLGSAKAGKKVWVDDCFKGYCYINQKGGADGWVLKSSLDFYVPKKPKKHANVEVCLGGGGFGYGGFGYGSFCISD